MHKGKLLVITSGGDAPGMNAALRAVVRSAIYQGFDVFGAEAGYCGLLQKRVIPLGQDSVANCIQRGGTILKTGRCLEFKNPNARQGCIEFLQQENIEHLVVLGGDGSFRGASLLAAEGGLRCIGIPCTIDNDINGTEYCIGFNTACSTALEAIDKIRDTAFSLDRNFIIEVMGRSSGFIAVEVGIAGGAEIILTPEFPITTDALIDKLRNKKREKLTSIIVAAESDAPGHSVQLAEDIKHATGIEYKVCILGHTQRGGTPTVYDRKMASVMGAKAVEAICEGHSNKMVAVVDGKIAFVPFPHSDHGTRYFSNQALLHTNEILCEI